MRIATLHYHLRPGGVTKVIQNALEAMSGHEIQTVIIAGEAPDPSMPIPNAVLVEGLGYYEPSTPTPDPQELVNRLKTTVRQHLGTLPDIWHVHNHCLGKNLVLAEIVHLLVREGQHVLLQPHDFAEDGRPDNYKFLREGLGSATSQELGARLYPQGEHIHYALINLRDLNFLRTAGVDSTQLHYMPNAVRIEREAEDLQAFTEDAALLKDIGRLYFYPARAIRRKNIGEFLFWAALAEEGDLFAIARAPKNPLARPVYDGWVQFATSHRLPVEFGMGERWRGNFPSLLQAAHALVSTSVAEGFGLAFLEPWLAGRPLIGRNLPEVTDAIEGAGVSLSGLYQRLDVPLDWVGTEEFRQEVRIHLEHVYQSYGRKAGGDELERALAASIDGQYVEFGKLNECFQQKVIQHLLNSPEARSEIRPPSLNMQKDSLQIIQANRGIVQQQFNIEKYGERLWGLYQTVANSGTQPCEALDADKLLDRYLAPERFCLLCS
ncbi:MAG: glycosyltransferase family 4 protein [bacterium]|nr:glycosyltransferase family 4 protein [bacterium]